MQHWRKEHHLTFVNLIQLTASIHQAKGSYRTFMMYSHQSSLSCRPNAALSQMSIMWKTHGSGGKGKIGGLRLPIMGKIGCECCLRITTVQFWRKKGQMHMMQRKCSSGYHISCLIVMMWSGILKKTGKIGDGICGLKMLKQNMREEIGSINRNPGSSSRNHWKITARFFTWGWEKSLNEKQTKYTR